MPTLTVLQGPDKGRVLASNDDVVVIGRVSDQAALTDQTVSRRHAEISRRDGVWVLSDLNSANGTFLNGARVSKPVRLKHGDQIRVGRTVLSYGGDEATGQLTGHGITTDMVTLDAGRLTDASIVSAVPSSDDSVVMLAPDADHAIKAWNVMRELTAVLGSLRRPEELLPRVLEIIFEQVEADRGVVFIRDEQTNELLPEAVLYRERRARGPAGRQPIVTSRTILNHVLEKREAVVCANVIGDTRFETGKSVQNMGMRSVICAPIIARDQILGVIHLDAPIASHTFSEDELRLITTIGYQTGLAIENARLVQAQVERERLAATGETIAYLSHAIKNILQGMRSGADVVERGLDRRDFAVTTQGWRILERNLNKCYNLMLNMLAYSKTREPVLEPMQIAKVAGDVVELMQPAADEARVMLLTDFDENAPPIPLDEDGMHQVLLNLVSNALDVVPRGSGMVHVRTRYDADHKRVLVSVSDNGPGVPEGEREKVFNPFFSTKGQGGTGLGLAVARKVVQEHNGTIELLCPKEGGAEFLIQLPVDGPRGAPGDTQAPTRGVTR